MLFCFFDIQIIPLCDKYITHNQTSLKRIREVYSNKITYFSCLCKVNWVQSSQSIGYELIDFFGPIFLNLLVTTFAIASLTRPLQARKKLLDLIHFSWSRNVSIFLVLNIKREMVRVHCRFKRKYQNI